MSKLCYYESPLDDLHTKHLSQMACKESIRSETNQSSFPKYYVGTAK